MQRTGWDTNHNVPKNIEMPRDLRQIGWGCFKVDVKPDAVSGRLYCIHAS